MPATHLINRVSVLGSGLIGGSFALALRKYTEGMHITVWDKPDTAARAKELGAADEIFSGELEPAIQNADLIYVALPISTTLDVLAGNRAPRAASMRWSPMPAAPRRASCRPRKTYFTRAKPAHCFLGGHPMAGKEVGGNRQRRREFISRNNLRLHRRAGAFAG